MLIAVRGFEYEIMKLDFCILSSVTICFKEIVSFLDLPSAVILLIHIFFLPKEKQPISVQC